MTEEHPTPVDVMSLDKNSELAARLHGDPAALAVGATGRHKSASPNRRMKNQRTAAEMLETCTQVTNMLLFEPTIPYEMNFGDMVKNERDRYYRMFYSIGCRIYCLFYRFSKGDTTVPTKPVTDSTAKSTIAKIAKTLGFSSSSSSSTSSSSSSSDQSAEYPSIETLLLAVEERGLSEMEIIEAVRNAIAFNEIPYLLIDGAPYDPVKLTTALAAEAISCMAALCIRYPPSRHVEAIMAMSQEGDIMTDEQLLEEEEDIRVANDQSRPSGIALKSEETPIEDKYKSKSAMIRRNRALDMNSIQQNGLLMMGCAIGFIELVDFAATLNKMEFEGDCADTQPLMEAAAAGVVKVVQKLLALGMDANAKSKNNQNTPLMYAVVAGNMECVEALLRSGRCSLTVNNCNGHDVLMEAANCGRLEMVNLLLQRGAKSRFLNLNSEFKESALTLAAYKGHLDIVNVLLESLNEVSDDDHEKKCEREEELHTAVMEASMDGHIEVVRLLLNWNAPVNLNSESFESPLTLACCGGHPELADILIQAGANIDDKNDENYTPLMEAAREGHTDVVRVLLAHGAKVDVKAEDNGDTPLSVAACGGFIDIMEMLIAKGADLSAGETPPIVEAAQEGLLDTVNFILQKAPKLPVKQLDKALAFAADCGHREVVEALHRAGASVDAEMEDRTALMRAAKNDHFEIVKYLVAAKADVNKVPEERQWCALSLACSEGNIEIVYHLLKNGADPKISLKDNLTCVYEASRNGNSHLLNLLLEFSKTGMFTKSYEQTNKIPKSKQGQKSYKKSAQRKTSVSGPSHMSMSEMMMLFQGCRKKGGKYMCNDSPVSSHEIDMLQHLLRLQTDFSNSPENSVLTRQMVSFDSSRTTCDNAEDKNREVTAALRALAAVYGTHPDGKIKFPGGPNKSDLDRMYLGEPAPGIKQWAETVAHGWLEMERYCGHPIELGSFAHYNEGHSTNAAAAVSAAAAAATGIDSQTYLASVFAKMNNGEDMPRVPATVGSLNAASAAMSGISFHSEDAMRLFSQVQYLSKDTAKKPGSNSSNSCGGQSPGNGCTHSFSASVTGGGPQADSAFRAALLKMGNSFRDRKKDPSVPQFDLRRAFPTYLIGDDKTLESARKLKKALASVTNHHYTGVVRLAVEMERRYQENRTDEHKDNAWAMAFVASVQPCVDSNGIDIEIGERLLNKLSKGMSQPEYMQITKRVRVLINSEATQNKLKKELEGLIEDHAEALSFIEAVKKAKETGTRVPTQQQKNKKSSTSSQTSTQTVGSATGRQMKQTSNSGTLRRTHSEGDGSDRGKTVGVDKPIDSSLETPLSVACANGHKEVVELLIKEGANIEHRDIKGFTPLIIAATAGHAEIVEILLKNHAGLEAQSERTKDTALSLACSGGRKEVVELLLANGANKEHRNVSDYTPLSLASSGGYIDIVKMLLKAGCEINARTGSKLGISPLMLAAMNGHREATKILLEHGSDVNAQIETNRNTALTLASFQGRPEVVKLLLNHQANVEHRAKTGLTPLMEAANGGYTEVGALLLEKNADPNAAPVPSSRDTALTIAADKGHDKYVELLLEKNAHLDAKNKKGCTALWLACNGGHMATAEILVKHNADPDAFDNRKLSPMAAAFRRGHVDLVKFMVKHAKQFPSDHDLERIVAAADNEIRDKCRECAQVIRDAKNTQAASADKAAADLLALLEEEEEQARSKKQKLQEKKKKKKDAKKVKLEETLTEVEAEPEVEPEPEPEPEPVKIEPVVVEEPKKEEVVEKVTKKERKRREKEAKLLLATVSAPVQPASQPPQQQMVPEPVPSPTALSPRADEWVKASGKKAKPVIKKTEVKTNTIVGMSSLSSAAPVNVQSNLNPIPTKESSTTSSVTSEFGLEIDTKNKKQWTLTVGGIVISRVIGRAGSNINAVREATGATIEIDKQSARKDPSAERQVVVRGTPDAVRNAVAIIQMLVNDVEVQINDAVRSVLHGNSSVASSASSEGAHSRSGYESSSIPPAPQSHIVLKSMQRESHSRENHSGSSGTPTGNVWQQRMAARQEQIAKTLPVVEEPSVVVNAPSVNAAVAPLLPKFVEEPRVLKTQMRVEIAPPKPTTPVTPMKKEPVSAVVQPLQSVKPLSTPAPIARPMPPTTNTASMFPLAPQPLQSVQQQQQPMFSRAPGTRPNEFPISPFLNPLKPDDLPVAFGQFLPPTQSSDLRRINPLLAPQQPIQKSQPQVQQQQQQHQQPQKQPVIRPFGLDNENNQGGLNELGGLKLLEDNKLAEIWGSSSEKSGDPAWGSQLFSSMFTQPTPAETNSQDLWSGMMNSMFKPSITSASSQPPQPSSQNTSATPTSLESIWSSVPSSQPSVAQTTTVTSRNDSKSVPLFARSQSSTPGVVSSSNVATSGPGTGVPTAAQFQQQLQQTRQLALMQQQQQSLQQQQQSLLVQLQSSIQEQAASNNVYNQLAAQLLTHQESSSSSTGSAPGQGASTLASNYYQSPSYTDNSILGHLTNIGQLPQRGLKQFSGFTNDPQEDMILTALIGNEKQLQKAQQQHQQQQQQNYIQQQQHQLQQKGYQPTQSAQPQPQQSRNPMMGRQASYGAPPPPPPPGFGGISSNGIGAPRGAAAPGPPPFYGLGQSTQQTPQQQQPPQFSQFSGQGWGAPMNSQQQQQSSSKPSGGLWGNSTWN